MATKEGIVQGLGCYRQGCSHHNLAGFLILVVTIDTSFQFIKSMLKISYGTGEQPRLLRN